MQPKGSANGEEKMMESGKTSEATTGNSENPTPSENPTTNSAKPTGSEKPTTKSEKPGNSEKPVDKEKLINNEKPVDNEKLINNEKPAGSNEVSLSSEPRLLGPSMCCSMRLMVSLLAFFGCFMVCLIRVDANFAIVCMVNATAVNQVAGLNNSDLNKTERANEVEGSLIWSRQLQGGVLSAYFWGYFATNVIGVWITSMIGNTVSVGGIIIITSILTLLSPLSANSHVNAFIAVRAAIGLVHGASVPTMQNLLSAWSPPLERGFLVSFALAGLQAGNIMVMSLSGFLCKYGFAGGWPSIFYVIGVIGILWTSIWFLVVTDSPSRNKLISGEEREYITASLANVISDDPDKKKPAVPWLDILRSVPAWGTYAAHFAGDWGIYMMMTCLPMFMNDTMGLELTSMGILASIPYVSYTVFINLGGMVADKLLDLGVLSVVNVRRLMTAVAFVSQAIFLVLGSYCGKGQETWLITCLSLGIGLAGVQFSGYVISYMDIAPAYAGVLYGIGNTFSCIGGLLCPIVAAHLAPGGTQKEWQLVFWVTAAILMIGLMMYMFLVKGDVEPWALVEQKTGPNPESKGTPFSKTPQAELPIEKQLDGAAATPKMQQSSGM